MDKHECICACALNKIFGFKPLVGLALIELMGSCASIFELSRDDINEILGPYSKFKNKISRDLLIDAEKEVDQLKQHKDHILPITDKRYPKSLRNCDDPPICLYIRSASSIEEIFDNSDYISIVGTRDISPYGREWCQEITKNLCTDQSNRTIVSGLAIGVDIIAHKTALEQGNPTLAIMATGIDKVYPNAHHSIARKIIEHPKSALISDYPLSTPPITINFLRRNRIIAGLSRATILIESKKKGGGMLTARLAHSYNRDVYALTGKADDLSSGGCNILIKERIAEPIISITDFLKDLGLYSNTLKSKETRLRAYLDSIKSEKPAYLVDRISAVIKLIEKNRGISIEEISQKTNLPYNETASTIRILESEQIITVDLIQRCCLKL